MNIAAIGALAGAAAVAGAFFYGQHLGASGERAAQQDRESVMREVYDRAALAAAEQIAKIEVKHVTQRQVLQREIVENVVYRDCVHSPGGLRAINDALVPGGTGGGAVPGVDPTQ